jgi:hypothetical protein
LLEGSFVNIIRFEKLYESSVLSDPSSVERAIACAAGVKASLGGTNILAPFAAVFGKETEVTDRRQSLY